MKKKIVRTMALIPIRTFNIGEILILYIFMITIYTNSIYALSV